MRKLRQAQDTGGAQIFLTFKNVCKQKPCLPYLPL